MTSLSQWMITLSKLWESEGQGGLTSCSPCSHRVEHDLSTVQFNNNIDAKVTILHLIVPGEVNGNPLQYSCLENPMGRGAWWAAVHGVGKSRAGLRDFTFNFHFHALEKEMVTHSSVLDWIIPGTVDPGGLLSMGSHRVGHN